MTWRCDSYANIPWSSRMLLICVFCYILQLIESDCHTSFYVLARFYRGFWQLLAFFVWLCRCLSLFHRLCHIFLDFFDIFKALFDYVIFDDPSEKIELPARRGNFNAVASLEQYAITTVERVEHSFGITLQLAFIFHENIEKQGSRGLQVFCFFFFNWAFLEKLIRQSPQCPWIFSWPFLLRLHFAVWFLRVNQQKIAHIHFLHLEE